MTLALHLSRFTPPPSPLHLPFSSFLPLILFLSYLPHTSTKSIHSWCILFLSSSSITAMLGVWLGCGRNWRNWRRKSRRFDIGPCLWFHLVMLVSHSSQLQIGWFQSHFLLLSVIYNIDGDPWCWFLMDLRDLSPKWKVTVGFLFFFPADHFCFVHISVNISPNWVILVCVVLWQAELHFCCWELELDRLRSVGRVDLRLGKRICLFISLFSFSAHRFCVGHNYIILDLFGMIPTLRVSQDIYLQSSCWAFWLIWCGLSRAKVAR